MIVRWLGAFRKEYTLHQSLQFELTRVDERAAERIPKGSKISLVGASLGLLFQPKDAIKHFTGDCWSEYNEEGKLVKTRNPRRAGSGHTESWVVGHPVAIVIKGNGSNPNFGYENLRRKTQKTIAYFAARYALKVYNFKKGKLVEVAID